MLTQRKGKVRQSRENRLIESTRRLREFLSDPTSTRLRPHVSGAISTPVIVSIVLDYMFAYRWKNRRSWIDKN